MSANYVLGIECGRRSIWAAIAAGERVDVLHAGDTDVRRVLEAAIRHEGGRRPAEIRLVGTADLPGALSVSAVRAVAQYLGAGPDEIVAVCDRGEATILRGTEILATGAGEDTPTALARALETAGVTPPELAALALIGAARHAEERIRHRFGRAEAMDDDAVAIGAATMPTPQTSWAATPAPAASATSWAAPPASATSPPAVPPSPPTPAPSPAASPSSPTATPPPAVSPPPDASPPRVTPRRRVVRRRRVFLALALLVLAGGAAAALSLRGHAAVEPRAACRAAMADGSDEGVARGCHLGDYVPSGSARCDWYIAAGAGTDCRLAVDVFANWFVERRSGAVEIQREGGRTLRFECSGEFLLECSGPGGTRAYVMRALDLLR